MALLGTPELVSGSIMARANVRGEYESVRQYRCYCSPTDSEYQVFNNLPTGLKRWSQDPGYAGFIVVEVNIADGPLCTYIAGGNAAARIWYADIKYGPWTSLFNATDGNPINQPPIASIEGTESRLPLTVDIDGNPILNTVSDPYDPPPDRQLTQIAVVVEQNLQNPNIVDMLTNWVDHINATAWKNFPARTLLVAPITLPKPEFYQDGNFAFYPMQFRLLFNPLTWDFQPFNQGFRVYDKAQSSTGTDSNNNPIYPLKDVLINGEPTREAIAISATGDYLPPPVNKQDIVINKHKVYFTVEFNNFPFANVVIPSGS